MPIEHSHFRRKKKIAVDAYTVRHKENQLFQINNSTTK